jgi:hypothetical protein
MTTVLLDDFAELDEDFALLLLDAFTLLLDDSFSSPLLEEASSLDEEPFKLLEDRAKLEEDFALLLEDVSACLLSLELLDFALLLDDSFIEEDCSLLLEDSGSAIIDDDEVISETGSTGLLPDPSSPQDNKTKASNNPETRCLTISSLRPLNSE